MIIREAKISDAASIARVHVDSSRTTYAGIMPQDYLNSLAYEPRTIAWQTRISDSTNLQSGWFLYVAEDDNRNVIGFAGGVPERDGNRPFTGELRVIYLLKSHQRQGIGRQLMVTVALRLQQQVHNSMLVWCLAANKYRSFYDVLGGKPIAERQVNIGGANLAEVAYGWQDLGALTKILESGSES